MWIMVLLQQVSSGSKQEQPFVNFTNMRCIKYNISARAEWDMRRLKYITSQQQEQYERLFL